MRPRFRRLSLRDYLEFAASDLGQRKLRTFLTAFGVTVGIATLVDMVGFGVGMQKNVTASFAKLDVFNSMTVLPEGTASLPPGRRRPDSRRVSPRSGAGPVLDDSAVRAITALRGVESAYPEIRFPAVVRNGAIEEFRLIQVVPAGAARFRASSLIAGRMYGRDDENAVVVGRGLLRQLEIPEADKAVGRTIDVASLSFDVRAFDPARWGAVLSGQASPLKKEFAVFTIVGVMDSLGGGGPSGLGGDVLLPPGPAGRMSKLPITNLWDLFRAAEGRLGYSAVNVRLTTPVAADAVKREVRAMGFATFALADQFEEIKTGFVLMDMILAAIGMIAIFVAALGIINTMVMAVLERTSEIGIMKAVGASPRDIQKIFVFEAGLIGLAGGLCGILLGWTASRVVNPIINAFGAKQGLPPAEYFAFPIWLCFGAIGFAVLVSLVSGLYPARRAARVDPAVALRHE